MSGLPLVDPLAVVREFVARGRRAQAAVDALGAGRPVEGPVCDECGAWPALHRVDSLLGLALWNRLYPEPARTALWFCTDDCILACGQGLMRHAIDRGVL